jgi:ferritin-like metal-binding protein YciE
MTNNAFYQLFLEVLKDTFDAENQIVAALPKAIQAANHSNLKTALSKHLEETRSQIDRLKKIFKTLNENPTGVHCEAMTGLIQECQEMATRTADPAIRDAGLIIALQKIEHYEISTYGSARALARHLNNAKMNKNIDFDEIADTLQQSLDEESEADSKLTEVAEGGFFTEGVNDEAEKTATDMLK